MEALWVSQVVTCWGWAEWQTDNCCGGRTEAGGFVVCSHQPWFSIYTLQNGVVLMFFFFLNNNNLTRLFVQFTSWTVGSSGLTLVQCKSDPIGRTGLVNLVRFLKPWFYFFYHSLIGCAPYIAFMVQYLGCSMGQVSYFVAGQRLGHLFSPSRGTLVMENT